MAVEVATAYVTLLPSARGFQAAMDKELHGVGTGGGKKLSADMADEVDRASRHGGVLHRAFTGIGGALVAATAGFGAIKLLGGFIGEAQEAETMSKRTAAVLKSTGGVAKVTASQISDLAGALSLKSGVDDEVIQSGENVLLTFTKVANAAGKGNDIFNQATGIALDMSKALGTDLQGSVIQVGKALNDPIKGVTALQRVGVSFTKQQKDQIKTLVESGDTLGAQKLILKELNTEFGGAAAASATSGEKLQVAWGNIQETLGGLILPIFSKVAEWLADMLPGAADLAISAFDALTEGVEYFIGGFTSDFTGEGTGVLYFLNVLGEAVGHAWDAVREFAPKIWDVISAAFNAVWNFLADIVPKIRDIIVDSLTTAYDWVMDHWEAVRDVIVGALSTAYDWVKDKWPTVRDTVVNVLSAIVRWVKDHWDNIKDTLTGVFDAFKAGVRWLADNKEFLIGALVTLGGYYVVLGAQAVAAGVASAAAWVAAAAVPILIGLAIAAVVGGFIYLYNHFDNFRHIVDAVVAGTIAAGQWLYEAWGKYADDIGNVLRDIGVTTYNIFVGIVDVVRTTVEVISAIVRGGIATWNALWPEISFVAEVVHGAFDMTVEIIKGAITMITALIEGAIMVWKVIWATVRFLYDVIHGAVDMVIEIVRGMIDTVRRIIEIGVATVQTTWAAIVGIFHFFRDQVYSPLVGAVSTLATTITDLFGIAVLGARLAWGGIVAVFTFFKDYVYTPVTTAVLAMGNFIIQTFAGVVSGVQMVWDGIKRVVGAPINVAIGFYNNGIKKIWDAVAGWVGLGSLPDIAPLQFAVGGTVPGAGNRDTVRAMLTPGEFVIQKAAAQEWPPELLDFLNDPRNAKGQTVDPGIFGYAGGGPVYRSGDDVLNFARQQVGKPYSYSAGGSGNADCSYLWSVLVNYALGAGNPYTRRFSTGTIQGDRALAPGLSDLATGMNMGVRPPYQTNKAGQFVGHMAGTLMGVNFESTPPATRMSPAARGATDGFPVHYYLPGFGGPNAVEQAGADQMVALHSAQMAGQPGPWGDLFTRLINQIPGKLFDFLMTKLPGVIVDAVTSAVGAVVGAVGSAVDFLNPFSHELGGPVTRDGPILVGEKRPEIVWGSKGEYVQDRLAVGSGGGPLNVFEGPIYGDAALKRLILDTTAERDWKQRAAGAGRR